MAVTDCSATIIQAALTPPRTVPCRRRLTCDQKWTMTAAALRSRHCKVICCSTCSLICKPYVSSTAKWQHRWARFDSSCNSCLRDLSHPLAGCPLTCGWRGISNDFLVLLRNDLITTKTSNLPQQISDRVLRPVIDARRYTLFYTYVETTTVSRADALEPWHLLR